MKIRVILISIVLFFVLSKCIIADACANEGIVSSSSSIFFSKDLGKKIEQYNSFSAIWWNFIVTKLDWDKADSLCKQLKVDLKDEASIVQCGSDINAYASVLKSWAQDLPNRKSSIHTKELLWESNKSLLRLALVSDKSLISIIRNDPLGTYRDYIKIKESNKIIDLKQINGFLVDETNGLLIVPIMMLYPPSYVERTSVIYNKLKLYEQMVMIGPHASNYENYNRVILDVNIVTYVALALFLFLSFILLYYKKHRLYLLIPAVCLSSLISTVVTVFVFGSIHGLTISFGIGILGISFDYGAQSIFSANDKKKIWLRNFMGLITTLIVLITIGISEIPLLRQMMFFSTVGLITSYFIFAAMDKYLSKMYIVVPFNIKPVGVKIGGVMTIVLMVMALLSALYIKPDFSVAQFDYQDKESKTIRNAIFKNIKVAPLFLIQRDSSDLSILDKSQDILSWSNSNNIRVETLAKYVPRYSEQQKNIVSWENGSCKKIKDVLKVNNLNIFDDYFEKSICDKKTLVPGKHLPPAYLKHLESNGSWLTIWFPKDKIQMQMVKERFLNSTSVLDLVSEFPKILAKELLWKVPLSFLLIVSVLFLYYRSITSAILATLPFLSGIGLFSVTAALLQLNVTFISLVGLLMVYGFSIDYGIFATDADEKNQHIWSSLLCAGLTTVTGFAPLLFAKHPVLVQLGQVLFIGTIGTFIGAFWGIPFVKQTLKRKYENLK